MCRVNWSMLGFYTLTITLCLLFWWSVVHVMVYRTSWVNMIVPAREEIEQP